MTARLTVIRWRDIPAQVIARDGRQAHKIVLRRRFQVAIEGRILRIRRAPMKAGLRAASDYIGEWRQEQRPCGSDLVAEAEAEARRLEAEHTRDVLARLVGSGGRAAAAEPSGG